MTGLRTEAWLLRGISAVPGELRLGSGVVSFTASGTGSAWPFQIRRLAGQLGQPSAADALERGDTVQLFAWPVDEVVCTAPWFFFGGGIVLRRRGMSLRVSFGRPVGTRRDPGHALEQLREAGTMRARGRHWVTALAEAARQRGDTA